MSDITHAQASDELCFRAIRTLMRGMDHADVSTSSEAALIHSIQTLFRCKAPGCTALSTVAAVGPDRQYLGMFCVGHRRLTWDCVGVREVVLLRDS